MSSSRELFEAAMSASPFERSVARYVKDESIVAWPGQYRDNIVQIAWEFYQEGAKEGEALRAALTELVACKDLKVAWEKCMQERDYTAELYRSEYDRRKDPAWDVARSLIAEKK